jgi:hypothetical protein
MDVGGETVDAIRIDGTSTTTTTAAGLPIRFHDDVERDVLDGRGVGIVRYSTSGEGYTRAGS